MKYEAYSRAERLQQIQDEFYKLIDKGIAPELTVYKLAKLLNMSPSPHLKNMLWELVNDGTLESRAERHRPNSEKTIFFIHPDRYSFPKNPDRTIKLNGQMSLF
jgi:hypothetical protein